ncbi:acylphosphatase [Halobacillus litoralis]|uniref:acylphosphatase n=1 Tax=Halobacillus litoralis TaxID=45668 RepID=UPI001CFCB6B9|nr:acylphosphatase [Halobacillus litoralis]
MENNQIIVYGHVQGVGFRAAAKQIADRSGIFGWVKNQPDGTVLIEAEGEKDQLHQFLTKIDQGPTPFSKVESMDVSSKSIKGYDKFRVIH